MNEPRAHLPRCRECNACETIRAEDFARYPQLFLDPHEGHATVLTRNQVAKHLLSKPSETTT
jgi:hypothetical protein